MVSVSNLGNAGANGNRRNRYDQPRQRFIGRGTLVYTGSGETTTKVIILGGGTGGATIDQSGASGTLIFTSDLSSPNNSNKTLTLQGSTAGVGEFRGKIAIRVAGSILA